MSRALLIALIALTACTSARDPIPHGQSGDCARCHLPEFAAAPEHPQLKPTTCSVCHGQQSWKPTFLDHTWPLTGAHRKLDCFKCHTGTPPAFEGTKRACYDCHRKDYEGAPFHETLQKTCADCHNTKKWKDSAKWPPKPEPSVSVTPEPSVSVVPPPSVSVVPSASVPKPKPKPKPKPQPTTKPPDIISHPSGF